MEILSFDIEGKFAHFRKYFANNTTFTFGIPPRTTIMGIIAAALGLEKDSYYLNLSSENLRIGVFNLFPVKKSFHRLNFLSIKGDSDFRGRLKHIQTPFEIISGLNPKTDRVAYRIYLASTDLGLKTYELIKEAFIHSNFRYNPTLGTANFTAQIKNVKVYKNVERKDFTGQVVELYSAGISGNIQEIFFEKADDYRYNLIEEELMPADFKDNNDREVVKMNRVLFTTGGIPLKVKLAGEVYILKENDKEQIIQFLE
jgi:CRISPR-associated protein Cas5h